MLKIDGIKLNASLKGDELNNLREKVAKTLRIEASSVKDLSIIKKSTDARKKPDIFFVYSLVFNCDNESRIVKKNHGSNISFYNKKSYAYPHISDFEGKRPIVIGLGPAGLFCGYSLAKMGYKPIIFERGKCIAERSLDVKTFWEKGLLNPDSNVLFGEGGAGTFSDGKLNTLNKDINGRNSEVLRIFHEHGAPIQITYDNKPHIGTDVLRDVVASIREDIKKMGGEIYYNSRLTDIEIKDGKVSTIIINESDRYETDSLVLAIGHSARDCFKMLYEKNIPMEAKAFAVGMRVQHKQDDIDINQYGKSIENTSLPVASYKLTSGILPSERSVYSFCMCPGGYVVNSSSEEGYTSVNGMSYHDRASGYANSAIIVNVSPDDYEGLGPLAGIEYQRKLEKRAFELGGGSIPVQYYGDYKNCVNKGAFSEKTLPSDSGRFKGSVKYADLSRIFDDDINNAFIEGMEIFDKKIKGFAADNVILAGVESRTSSPVRIKRNEDGQTDIKGLFPCGEGPGYAGGISSAAMDGLYIAECIYKKYEEK